jgi:hypothetical protein
MSAACGVEEGGHRPPGGLTWSTRTGPLIPQGARHKNWPTRNGWLRSPVTCPRRCGAATEGTTMRPADHDLGERLCAGSTAEIGDEIGRPQIYERGATTEPSRTPHRDTAHPQAPGLTQGAATDAWTGERRQPFCCPRVATSSAATGSSRRSDEPAWGTGWPETAPACGKPRTASGSTSRSARGLWTGWWRAPATGSHSDRPFCALSGPLPSTRPISTARRGKGAGSTPRTMNDRAMSANI